ncbi:MAG TPA: hypothetical protein PLR75_05335 [Candidatus Pacearchaeota archaeon]|nr:hypothetical protein [Candidatus Pacearchaeota archaeon]
MPNKEFQANKEEAEILLSLGILRVASDAKQRLCPTCGNEFLDAHFINDTKAFTQCEQNEDAGRDYFNPQELKQWDFDVDRFLELFQDALGIKSPKVTENIPNLLWDFGNCQLNGATYHPFFAANIDQIEKPKLSIVNTPLHSVVFYVGTPHTQLPTKVITTPLADYIQAIESSGITVNEPFLNSNFPQNIYQTDNDSIILDDNIALRINPPQLLFDKIRGGQFRAKENITRLDANLVSYLFSIKAHNEMAQTSRQLGAEMSKNGSQKSILNRIAIINGLCKKNKALPILHKYDGAKYGLNSDLGYFH